MRATFILALALTAGFSCLAARFLGPLGWMDAPGGRKSHANAVPRTGGIAILCACLLGSLCGIFRLPFTALESAILLAMALIGLLDDRFSLPARKKALLTLLVVIPLAVDGASFLVAAHTQLFLAGLPIPMTWLSYFALLVFAYWSIPQGVNLIDGANGLALG